MVTSRERVLAALRHEETDRIPIDLGSHASSTLAAKAYMNLRRYLGVPDEPLPRMYNTWGQCCDVQEPVLERLGCDVVPLHRAITSFAVYNDRDWKEWTLADGSRCLVPDQFTPQRGPDGDWQWHEEGRLIARMPAGGEHGFTLVWSPMQGEPTREKIDRLLASDGNNFVGRLKTSDRELDFLRKQVEQLRASDNSRAVLFQHGGTILENAQGILGYEEIFIRAVTDPDLVHYCLGALAEIHLDSLARTLAVAGPDIDIIQFGDDLGSQMGPLMAPEMYRRLVLPYHRKMFAFVRQHYPHIHVLLHTDGAVAEFLPDLIDAGMQILNPLQTDCPGMDPVPLKRRFGRQITFWGGGCDTHGTLAHGSPEQVREDVRRRIEVLAPGGGFVFNPIHNVLPEIPPQNIVAMFEAARQWGTCPVARRVAEDELESRYAVYWAEPQKALESEGIL